MKDAELKHKTRRLKCIRTNKLLAKAEFKTRKAFLDTLIKKMKTEYEKTANTGGSEQLKELDKCLQFKRPASNDFLKIAHEILSLKKQ